MESVIEGYILGLPANSPLRIKLTEGETKIRQNRKYAEMEEKFALAGEIYRSQLEKIKMQNPGVRISADDQILSMLGTGNTSVIKVGDVIQVEKMVEKTV